MNDQQRIETAADNCEVLRARLARYEDAEGRPLQRGGEVLSDEELWSIRNQVAIHQVLRDDDSVKICVKHGRAIEQAVLARLNSSPVSAGEPVYQFQCREIGEGDWEPCDHSRYMYCQKSPEMDTRVVQVQALSAPSHGEQVRHMVPDGWNVERGCSPSGYVLHSPGGSMIRVCDSGMGGIETAFAMFLKAMLAAPSAPSHGDQVREGWKLVPVEPTPEMISAASGAITKPDDLPPVGVGGWSMSDLAFRSRYRAAIAAAPSAGSQEQGE